MRKEKTRKKKKKQGIKSAGWPTCHSHGGGVVRDSLVQDEPAGGGGAVARVPQLGVGALRGVDGHTGGYYL